MPYEINYVEKARFSLQTFCTSNDTFKRHDTMTTLFHYFMPYDREMKIQICNEGSVLVLVEW